MTSIGNPAGSLLTDSRDKDEVREVIARMRTCPICENHDWPKKKIMAGRVLALRCGECGYVFGHVTPLDQCE